MFKSRYISHSNKLIYGRPDINRRDDLSLTGFTLLEVLLAIIIITVGFTTLLQAVSTGLFAGGDNENMLVAINLAQEKMEELRNRDYSNVINETKNTVSGFSVFQREVVTSTIQTGLKQISVNVYWFVKSDELSLNLVSYVSDI